MTEDEKHLDLLAIFYYIFAGLSALFACIPFVHLGIGIAIALGKLPIDDKNGPIPEFIGWIIVAFAAILICLGWLYAVCMLFAGRFLQQRRRPTFCMVMAALSCLSVPFGTCLGVFNNHRTCATLGKITV